MDDDKVRALLDRYQPVGPAGELRERALAGAVRAPRTWPWAAAAAALLAATVGLHAATNRELARVVLPSTHDPIEALTAAIGEGEVARQAARLIVAEQEFTAWLAGRADAPAGTIEEELSDANRRAP